MFGRKKKKEVAAAKGDAPKKQSQLAVVKDAYRLVVFSYICFGFNFWRNYWQ
jgi:hypothetical protein